MIGIGWALVLSLVAFVGGIWVGLWAHAGEMYERMVMLRRSLIRRGVDASVILDALEEVSSFTQRQRAQ